MSSQWGDLHPITQDSILAQQTGDDGRGPICGCRIVSTRSIWLCSYHEGVDYGAETADSRTKVGTDD